jgi:hypothetical protein
MRRPWRGATDGSPGTSTRALSPITVRDAHLCPTFPQTLTPRLVALLFVCTSSHNRVFNMRIPVARVLENHDER